MEKKEKKARCEAEHALQVIRNPSAKHESGGLVYDTRARRVKVFSDKPDAPRFLLFNSGRCVLRVFFFPRFLNVLRSASRKSQKSKLSQLERDFIRGFIVECWLPAALSRV